MYILRTATCLLASLWVCGLAGCGASDEGMDEPSDAEILPGDPRFERDPALDVENISAAAEKRSHNMGQNCIGCHQPHGPGKGLFTTAGTVYAPSGTPVTGGTVELRTAGGGEGELVLSVAIDGNGNFFTTEPLPFPDQALFFFVRSQDGEGTNEMPFPSISGACNLCHNEQRRILLE
ncbi:hypothetical protein WME95_38155 [Sorangium sp. So ce327]|uniref:hypothetical protein n=1 Tax=Sorangium sp. So ce327 TaxID=3133301 RepID=UPI003F62AF99